jgi:hypothetical protein
MHVKFLKAEKSSFGEFQAGDVENIHDPEAERLIADKIAEAFTPPVAKAKKAPAADAG